MRLLLCVVALALQMSASGASAATFAPKGFDDLVAEAEQVFIGTAGDSASRYNDRRAIVTDVTFENVQVIKGAPAQGAIVLTLLGGKVGDLEMQVRGAPQFQRGTRYLVFAAGNGSVMFPMVGGPQGVFQVRADPDTGALQVFDSSGRPVTALPPRPGTKSALAAPQTLPQAPMSVDAFTAAIRNRLPPQARP